VTLAAAWDLAELLCWGIYGLHRADPRLIVVGWTGVVGSVLMLVRAYRAGVPQASC